jgi:hypothetical protein
MQCGFLVRAFKHFFQIFYGRASTGAPVENPKLS